MSESDPFAVPMIFFRTTWMVKYDGITADDKPARGGEFVKEREFGYEIYNFRTFNGSYYGFVQAPGSSENGEHGTIRLERLDKSAVGSSLPGVLVIWVATAPKGGSRIVGWYRNATVFRKMQQPPAGSNRTYDGNTFGYFATCKVSDGSPVSLRDRTFAIPQGKEKGGFGRVHTWFADDRLLNREIRAEVLTYINTETRSATLALPPEALPTGDQRMKVVAEILARPQQAAFREALRQRYGDGCQMTGCPVMTVTHASHLVSVADHGTDDAANGLLLRADVHLLFDVDLIGIEPDTLRVCLAPELTDTDYAVIAGTTLRVGHDRPNRAALDARWARFNERVKPAGRLTRM